MIGYHYTSYTNWLKIKKEGLVPYYMKNLFSQGFQDKGVWLWKYRMHGKEHIGNLIYQLSVKAETKIVVLRVKYDKKDIWQYPDYYQVIIHHDGEIGKFKYHNTEDKVTESVTLTKAIPPEDISLIKMYDLIRLLR